MNIVSNSSPLIFLSKIGRLDVVDFRISPTLLQRILDDLN